MDLFHSEMDKDGILGNPEGNPLDFISSLKLSMELHPPVQTSGNSFPRNTARTRFPLIKRESKLHDQRYARGEKVTLGATSQPSFAHF